MLLLLLLLSPACSWPYLVRISCFSIIYYSCPIDDDALCLSCFCFSFSFDYLGSLLKLKNKTLFFIVKFAFISVRLVFQSFSFSSYLQFRFVVFDIVFCFFLRIFTFKLHSSHAQKNETKVPTQFRSS